MESPPSPDTELETRIRQQEVVAELGQRALETDDVDGLMRDAAAAVVDTLGTDLCEVLELDAGDDELHLRQGAGWRDGTVGAARVPTDRDSQAGYTLLREEPVVVEDLRTEERFAGPELLTSHDVVSGVTVAIGSVDDPWGVLGTHTTAQREFTEHDANFVRSVANVLASTIENERRRSEIEEVYGRISDAFFALDEEWRFTYVNERAHELINPEGRSLVGERIWDTFPEAIGKQLEPMYERAMYDQETVTFEEYYPDPLDAWFEVRAYPSETGLSIYFRDVTDRKERERELQRKERRYQATFEDPNILVGLLEPDGTVLDINRTAMEYVDADLADVTGEPFWETPWWGEGDDAQGDVREWVERAADGEYVDFEADLTRPDGERYVLNGFFRPVTDENGDVVSVIVSDRDVTERREYERRLAESEQRYRALAENFPNGLVTLFDEDRKYTLASGRAFEYLPVDPDDVQGHSVREAWGDEAAAVIEPLLETALAGESDAVELSYVGRDWILHAVPITYEDGDVFGGMTMAQDITERKERERRLERYKEYTDDVLDAIDDVFYVVDEDGALERWNGSLSAITGYPDEEVAAMDPTEFFVDDDAAAGAAAIAEGFETGSVEAELTVETKAGDAVPFEFVGSRLEDPWGNTVLAGIGRDVTERKERERALAESERRYRTLVEHFPEGAVGLFDEDLRYTAVGGELVEATGLTPDERVGSRVAEIYPADVVAEVEPYFEAALAGESHSFEVEYHDRHLHAYTLPVEDDDGEVFAGMLVVQDVTERREAQRELRESEAKFRMIAENLEEVVWMADADAESFSYVNPAFEDVWGVSREALYEDPSVFRDSVHPDDRERVLSAFDALPDEEFDEEYRIQRPDGAVRWIHSRGAKVHDEAAGMVRVVGIGEDVTERKERNRELERALDLLEKTERIADVGGWEVDADTRDVFWSDHLFDLLGVDAGEEPPLDEALDMYHEDDRPVVEDAIESALETGDPLDEEVRIRTADGDVRWLRLQAVPEVVDDEVVSLRGAAQDVTERTEREQRLEELVDRLEESNERLEQFAYAASHDLQEPLRMVSSYLQLIERRYADALDEEGREFLEFAVDGADRMRDMIDGLLEYSRVETRGDPFEYVDLDEVLADARDDLRVMIEESDAEITAESLPVVEGDPGQLRQVFQNLLDNAIQYSGDEPPRIRISAERRTEYDDRWVISVSDEGIGMDPEDADRVFEVFQRLHARGDHGGTGIGLALCERVVERHGGEIWADTESGEGATFSFTLPPGGDGDA